MAFVNVRTPLKNLKTGDYFYPLTNLDQIITGSNRLSVFMSEDSSNHNLLNLNNIGNLNVNGNTTINGNLTVSGAISGNSSSTTKLLNTRTIWGQNFNGTQNISGDMADVGPSIRLPSGQANFDFLTSTGGAANGKFGRILLSGNYSQGNITDYKLYVDGGSSYFNGQIYISYNTTATLGIDSNLKIGTAQKNIHIATRNGTNSGINDGYAAGITFGDSGNAYAGIYYQSSGSYGSRLHFATTGSYANGAYTRMFISSGGYVGIGTITPSQKLHVSGGAIAITHNGNTVTIGSLNTSWCHFQNSANIPFYFDNKISVNGDLLPYTNNARALGNSSYKWNVIYGTKVYGAVWNDYAEFRETKKQIEAGRCIIETGQGDLILSSKRLQEGCEIVSDTYGFAIGQSEKCNTPTATTGRVLAYPYENKELFKPGKPVCSGPNGTVSIMTEEEARKYPWCIIGTVSEIPIYTEWYCGDENDKPIQVNGRIWIRIR